MIMQWSFFAVMGLLFVGAVFFNISTAFRFSFREQIFWFVVITALFCITAFFAGLLLAKLPAVERFLCEKYRYVVFGVMGAIFVLQIIFAGLIYSDLVNDVDVIILNAQATTPDQFVWIEYFSLHPNNLLLLFLFRFIRLALAPAGLEGSLIPVLIGVNILAVNAAAVLTFFAVKEIFGTHKAYVAWIFTLVLVAFTPRLIVPYSDTLSMPFAISFLYLYAKLVKCPSENRKIALALAMGVIAQVGFLIKPSSIIPLIAVCVIQVLMDARSFKFGTGRPQIFKEKSKKQRARNVFYSKYLLTYTLVGLVAAGALFNLFTRTQSAIPFQDGIAVPAEHYIMMGMQVQESGGLYSFGSYNAQDVAFTMGFGSTEAKRAAAREVISERLAGFGVGGYLEFLVNKARWITGDGTFYWGRYFALGNFEYATPMQLQFRNIFFPRGENYAYYAHVAQGLWLFVLFWYFVAAFRRKDTSDVFVNICVCALIGIILFILLTEGRSRYLFNHLPYFAIVSSMCFVSVFNAVTERFRAMRQ